MNPEHEHPKLEIDVLGLAAEAAANADPALAWRAADGLASALMNEVGSWVEDHTEHSSLHDLVTRLVEGRRLQLRWKPLNPEQQGGADDFLLEDQHRRVYAHAEQMDEDTWWANVYVMENPGGGVHFTGPGAKDNAQEYCEELVHLWSGIRERVAGLVKMTADHAGVSPVRFDARVTELPMPKERTDRGS